MSSEKETVTTGATETEHRKVTFGYTRKVGLPNYGSEEFSVYMTDIVPDDTDVATFVHGRSEAAADLLKQQVWDALGLAFSFTDSGTPVLDEVEPPLVPQVPAQGQQQAQPAQPPPLPQPRGNNQAQPPPIPQGQPIPQRQHPRSGPDQPSIAQVGVYAQFPSFCGEDIKGGCGASGVENFYDNRADNDMKIQTGQKVTPDFKCKKCKSGYFRPGSYDYNQNIGGGGSQQPASMAPPQNYGPDEAPF
jgi:hypothetical protein